MSKVARIPFNECIAFFTPAGLAVPAATIRDRIRDKPGSKPGSSLAAFLAKLTITTPVKIGKPKVATLYRWDTYNGVKCLFLPRGLALALVSKRVVSRVESILPPPKRVALALGISLFENQELVVNHLMSTVYTEERTAASTAACILDMRAGMGKTFVAAGIIARLGVRTLYVVPTEPLREQTIAELAVCFGSDAVGNGARGTHPFITVAIINTALGKKHADADIGLVVLDEVHMYCSKERRAIFGRASVYALGMTATPYDRKDGFDPIAHRGLCGVVSAEAVPGFTYDNVVFDCHARIIHYCGPAIHTEELRHASTDMVFTHYMHGQAIDDPYRTQLAVQELIALYDWDGVNDVGEPTRHHIYVLAEEINILVRARRAFADALIARGRPDIQLGVDLDAAGFNMFTGGLKGAEIRTISQRGRVLFSTFPYAGTGVSIPKMTAILMLTSRMANMKQIIPRCLRRGSDLSIPRIVVDIVDANTSMRKQAAIRREALDHYGFACDDIRVSWKNVVLPAANRAD